MELNAVFLSRLQFALTVMFHYLFVPMTIGLGPMLVFMEWKALKTGNPLYESMTRFWVKIFGLIFAMGVASGIVMEFQFGTNWATYSRYVGDVFGSALAAEGVFAFFLESSFLGVLLFGWNRVSKKMHFFSTIMVCFGSILSAVWIIVANSWQQTPAGFHIVGEGAMARAEITSFWDVVFNPSSITRLTHTVLGAFMMGAFFVMSVSAYYLLKKRHEEFARACFPIALVFAAVCALGQLATGHASAMVVTKHQPAKLAAFEGVFKTCERTPLHLFGIPDEEEEIVRMGLAVPGMLSLLAHLDIDKPVAGLDQIKPEDRPPLQLTFQSYHIMISLGMFFIAQTLVTLWLWWRGLLFSKAWLLKFYVVAVALPFLANQAGWVAAEVGRQPWVVYGLLRTSDATSKSVPAGQILASIILFGILYLCLFLVFAYVLTRKIQAGPDEPKASAIAAATQSA